MADLEQIPQGIVPEKPDLEAVRRMLSEASRLDLRLPAAEQKMDRPPGHMVPQRQFLEMTPLDLAAAANVNKTTAGLLTDARAVARASGKQEQRVLAAAVLPQIEDPQEVERRIIAQFEKQNPVEKLATVMARMPDRVSLRIDGNKLNFETNFGRFLEAVPGIRLDANAWQTLNNVKTISLEGDKFKAELLRPTTLKGLELNVQGIKLGELQLGDVHNPRLTFNVALDEKQGTAALTDIEGLKISSAGGILKFPITRVELVNKADGKQDLVATVMFGSRQVQVALPSDQAFPAFDSNVVKHTITTLAGLKSILNTRDLGALAEQMIPEHGLRDAVKNLFKGIQSIEKNGDQFAVTRDNGAVTYDAGGASIMLFRDVRFRLGSDPDRPSITDVQGLTVSLPLPEELHLGSRYIANIKSLSLGSAAVDGSRKMTIDADNMIERVVTRVNKDLVPVADGNGNYELDLRLKNPLASSQDNRLDIRLRIAQDGQLNLHAYEIADIISRAAWQASDVSFAGAGMAIIAGGSKVASWGAGLYHWLFD